LEPVLSTSKLHAKGSKAQESIHNHNITAGQIIQVYSRFGNVCIKFFLKLEVIWDLPEAYPKCGTCVSVPLRIRVARLTAILSQSIFALSPSGYCYGFGG
jgi:hypothetical protein